MKKILTVLLTLTVLNGMNTSLADSVPWGAVVANSRGGDMLGYDHLNTECAWQGLALPDDVMASLGDPQKMGVMLEDLPANVKVSLRPGRTGGIVGLKVTRTDKTQAIRQVGRIILTNPASGYSYTVRAMIMGIEVP
ncbi:hypothetical protein ACI3L1_14775 [Deinococcus sp. SM5_A1]|uniref:hypothetical protein n=1 Tax=Deinococcus sp. SM5_A1 TaxID=3379094 RepID=UPI00385DADED